MERSTVEQFLKNNAPHYDVEANVALLAGRASNPEQLMKAFGRADANGELLVHPDFQAYVDEFFSKNIEAQAHDGESLRRKLWSDKARADSQAEVIHLQRELAGRRLTDGRELSAVDDLTTLRDAAAQVREELRQRSLSSEALRAERKAAAPQPRSDGYPTLFRTLVVQPGVRLENGAESDGVHSTEITPSLLRFWAKSPRGSFEWETFKKFYSKYGSQQCDARMNEAVNV